MSRTIDFYFDFGSPASFLAYKRLHWLTQEYSAEINSIPVLLGGIFKATNNSPPATVPLKARWMLNDLARYAKLYGIDIEFNPFFPINTLYLMRGAVYAQQEMFFEKYLGVVFDAMWCHPQNMGDPQVVDRVLGDAGIDAKKLFEGIDQPSIKEGLKVNTEAAVARGVFGCPAMFYNDELFFGQDRIFFIENMLKSS